jgi:hypothetical protein
VDRRADANAAPDAARAEVGLEELGFEQTLQAPEPTPTPERCLAERWVLGEVLGRGASGVVHRASDRLGGPDVAVKLLAPMGDQALERIRRESAALRMLTIPGVVRLLDDGQEDGEIYLVMELVEGAPFPGRRGPVPWAALAEPTLALLEALAQVHDAGIVHRDLKPANVLVTAGRRARILDFGLARGEALGETMTRTGVVVGTPRYLAPEQVVGAGVDARADLYAVGAMLFEALAGRPPQDAPSVQALLHLKLSEDAPSLAGSDVAAPPAVVHLVDRLLSREPAERPSSASEVLGALSRMGAASGATVSRGSGAARRSTRWSRRRGLGGRWTCAAQQGPGEVERCAMRSSGCGHGAMRYSGCLRGSTPSRAWRRCSATAASMAPTRPRCWPGPTPRSWPPFVRGRCWWPTTPSAWTAGARRACRAAGARARCCARSAGPRTAR